jgi:hypothetical protein
MRHLMITLVVFFITFGITGCKKEDPDKTVKVYNFIGDVKVVASSVEKAAAAGDVLNTGDSISTGERSSADILFGTSGIIRIQEKTNISVASLMDQATGDSRLDMSSGKINVTLARLKKGTFSVKTHNVVAAVRGTTFRVTADDTTSRVDVVNGAVKVNPVQNNTVVAGMEKTVETNQTVELDEKSVKLAVEEKKEIKVKELEPEEIRQIKEEVKDMKPEIIEKLNDDARKEMKEKVLAPDDSAEKEKEKKEKDKKEKDQALKLLQEKNYREKMNIEKARLEKEKLGKEKLQQQTDKKQKEGTGEKSKVVPPSIHTL